MIPKIGATIFTNLYKGSILRLVVIGNDFKVHEH